MRRKVPIWVHVATRAPANGAKAMALSEQEKIIVRLRDLIYRRGKTQQEAAKFLTEQELGHLVDWAVNKFQETAGAVQVGQLWRRPNGCVYRVAELTCGLYPNRNARLVPERWPRGMRPRQSWKWEQAVANEMERVG